MAQFDCPYCDYSGTLREVEGHISGRSDGGHSGKVGQAHREDLREQVEENDGDGKDRGMMLLAATVLFLLATVAEVRLPNEEGDARGA